MTRPHTQFKDDHVPLAYLITFRGFGTWLHGDSRGSDRVLGFTAAAKDISGPKSNCSMQ
jgi:hypothetical protein